MDTRPKDDAERLLRRFAWPGEGWADLIGSLLAHGRIVDLAAGQWAQAEGDEETGVLVVLSGSVELLCKAPGDREVMISQAGPGAALGQTTRFGGGPRLLTVICQEPSRLLLVSDQALARIGQGTPRIWEAVAGLLYNQLRNLLQLVAETTALPPRQRLASRLDLLARNAPETATLRLTQHALGEMVGLTRKTVNAYLADFERQGLIRRTYGGIVISDPTGLRRVAEA